MQKPQRPKGTLGFYCLLITTTVVSISTNPSFAQHYLSLKEHCHYAKVAVREMLKHPDQYSAQDISSTREYAKKMCAGGAYAREMQAMSDKAVQDYENQQAIASGAASFLLGFATGFVGSYSPPVGRGPVVRSAPIRSAPRVVTRAPAPVRTYSTVSVPTTVRTAPVTTPVRTAPVTTSTVRTTTPSRSSGEPIGYITQPNGTKDPVYSKPPCATTAQTGPTSYECTNK